MNGIETTVIFFKDGFFGYGEAGSFSNGSWAHLMPIAAALLVIFLIVKYRVQISSSKYEDKMRLVLIAAMLLAEMGYFWRLLYVGPGGSVSQAIPPSMMTYLPIQVCEWTLFITVFMLISKSENMFHLVFSLVLSCNIIALIFPETVLGNCGPSTFRYYQYWCEHLLPIISVFYAMFIYGYKPKIKGILMALAELTILYILCWKANQMLLKLGEREWYMYIYILRSISAFADAGPIFTYIGVAVPYLVLASIPHLIYQIIVRKSRKKMRI